MFFELINNAFFDSTFFYLYLGLIVITFGIILLNHLYNNHFIKGGFLFNDKHQTSKINFNQIERPIIINESFVIWLIITFKRIDEKDDKADNFASYFKLKLKIRGGERWDKITYLLPYENIDLSF